MTDTNRVNVAYVKETTYGVTPSGPPTLKDLRFVSESVAQENTTVTSQEIRSDRQVSALLRTGIRAPGDLNFEFSYGAFDEWLEWSLLSNATWTTPVTIGPGPSFVVTVPGGVYTITRGTGSFITDGLSATTSVGQWAELRGFVNTGNNGYFKIASVSATVITFTGGTGTPSAEGANTSASIVQGAQITNGVALSTFALEKNFQDAVSGHQFEINNGMAIDRLRLEIPVDNIVTGTFGLLGKKSASASATAGTGSNTASAQNQVDTGVDNALAILEGPAYTAQGTVSANFELQNNLRTRQQLGTLGPVSLGTGTVNVTGQHRAYYTDKGIIDKANNQTVSALAYVLEQSAGSNAVVFDFPSIKYSAGKRVTPGINQDVIADMTWTAFRNATEGITSRIVRFV